MGRNVLILLDFFMGVGVPTLCTSEYTVFSMIFVQVYESVLYIERHIQRDVFFVENRDWSEIERSRREERGSERRE